MQILVEEKGMMPVKKSGVKLHIGVDILGLPHMLLITSANITDRNGAIEMLSYYSAKSDRLIRLQKILVDGGYSGEEFADAVWAICGAEVEVAKRNELHKVRESTGAPSYDIDGKLLSVDVQGLRRFDIRPCITRNRA